jgi:hypothetical protein
MRLSILGKIPLNQIITFTRDIRNDSDIPNGSNFCLSHKTLGQTPKSP